MMTIGSLYCLIPRLYNKTEMHSIKMIDVHFWLSPIGVVLYTVSMWIAGIQQGLMRRAFNADGTLTYSFIESLKFTYPYYGIRLLGGLIFFSCMLLMVYNVYKTVPRKAVDATPVAQPV